MSVRAMAMVFDRPAPAFEKLLLLALADHADDRGFRIFPSVARLCEKTSLSRATVQRVLRRLEAQELLAVVHPATHYRPTEYCLNLTLLGAGASDGGPSAAGASPGGARGLTQSVQGPQSLRPDPSGSTSEPSERAARARRLPDDFQLTQGRERSGIDAGWTRERAAQEFATFRDHFTANGKRMLDWDASWRNWVRRARQFGPRSAPGTGERVKPYVPRRPAILDFDRQRG